MLIAEEKADDSSCDAQENDIVEAHANIFGIVQCRDLNVSRGPCKARASDLLKQARILIGSVIKRSVRKGIPNKCVLKPSLVNRRLLCDEKSSGVSLLLFIVFYLTVCCK